MKPLRLWLSAGELSGDLQGKALVTAIKKQAPQCECMGMIGDGMKEAGCEEVLHIKELSVMGIAEVLAKLPSIVRLLKTIKKELTERRPDAIILIDAPSFNFRVTKIARKLGIPCYYFISPKVWAWGQGRVTFLKQYIEQLYCILPFEVDFFQKHGLDVTFVGNPLVDAMDYPKLDAIPMQPMHIGILAGSRKKEVSKLLPLFSTVAENLLCQFPELSFHCIKAPNIDESFLRAQWHSKAPFTVLSPENRYEKLRAMHFVMAASGTATLETALIGVPTLVAYIVSPITAFIGHIVIKIKYASLPNLIMNKELFPEFIQEKATPANLTLCATEWLKKPELLQVMRQELNTLRSMVGPPGAATRAATDILKRLAQ